MRVFTVEEANRALPRVRELVEQIRALAAGLREATQAGGLVKGNGQAPSAGARAQLERAVEALDRDGIVLRDLESGLLDFPAATADGRRYWLCWLPGEPEVAWWHWPEDGFAGRRPLRDPPG
jgi:hypothetical protein